MGPVLAVIPARRGSRGIPRKALADLCGRPLIQYTIDAARAARGIDRLIVSTDDDEVAGLAVRLGVEVPFRRPADLAGDTTPMADVLRHAVAEMDRRGFAAAAVVTLQPTSPLRGAPVIERCLQEFGRQDADCVVTVCPPRHHPQWMWRPAGECGDFLEPLLPAPRPARRQDLAPALALNGAVYVTARRLLEGGAVVGGRVRGVVMGREESVDIDEPLDLIVAAALLQARGAALQARGAAGRG